MNGPHRRRPGSLFTVWAAVIILVGGMYWLQGVMPAFVDMLRPLYALLGVVLLVATWKWLRRRNRNHDRRQDDRRQHDQNYNPPDDSGHPSP